MVRNELPGLVALLLSACPYSLSAGPPGEGWELVFHDEFNGKQLNRDAWMDEPGDRRNAYNDPEDSYLDGQGHLVLRVRKAADGKYHVGFLRSRKQFGWGYYEARTTLDTVPGYWSAFWLRGDKSYSPDYSGAEVDIMEDPYRGDTVSLNIHQGEGQTRKHEGSPAKIIGPRADWHRFACDWHAQGFDFWVDGARAWATRSMTASAPNRICLTQELQFGGWAGDIRKSESQLPAYWKVDYVRYYQRNPQAPFLAVSAAKPIRAGKENGGVIRVALGNGAFAPRLDAERWYVDNLPEGVRVGSVKRLDGTHARLTLRGNSRPAAAQPAGREVTVIAEPGEVAGSQALLAGTAMLGAGATAEAARAPGVRHP